MPRSERFGIQEFEDQSSMGSTADHAMAKNHEEIK